ncbi:uncharacterized protein [Palaemon carinicauda]|uniref:uncharacterized protein n=1 Tax=Palaemon carinicauda TaxID=392227 RepID=UPI0035B6AB64
MGDIPSDIDFCTFEKIGERRSAQDGTYGDKGNDGEDYEKIFMAWHALGYEPVLPCMSLTRYQEAIPARNIGAKIIAEKLLDFFIKFGIPEIVQSDRGTNFMSKLIQDIETVGCETTTIDCLSSGNPRCNETGNEWDIGLPLMLFKVHNADQENMGCSPNEMVFGREL